MPYTNLTPKNVGDPVLAEDFNLIDGNFDDHETRLSDIELASTKVDVFNFPVIGGVTGPTYTGLSYFYASSNFVLTEATITLFDISGTYVGDIEVDVQKGPSPDAGGMASVFLTKPSIDLSTAVSGDESTNAVFDPGQVTVSVGEWLRLDISAVPTTNVLGSFHFRIIGEV